MNGEDWQLCAKGAKENKARKDSGKQGKKNPKKAAAEATKGTKLPRRPQGRVRVRGRRARARAKPVGDPGLLLPGLPSAKQAALCATVVLTTTTVIVTLLWNMARSQTWGGARRPVCDRLRSIG